MINSTSLTPMEFDLIASGIKKKKQFYLKLRTKDYFTLCPHEITCKTDNTADIIKCI